MSGDFLSLSYRESVPIRSIYRERQFGLPPLAAAVFVQTSMQRYTPKFLISFGIAYFSSLDYGYQKSQYLCRFSDFKVRTKFLIGHHEILKRYETFSKKVRNTFRSNIRYCRV